MNIRFPQKQDPFPKALAGAIAASLLALIIGLFLGYCLGSLVGTNLSVVNTTNYTDTMSAARSIFTDADQLDSYVNTALTFQDMDGLKIYTGRDQETTLGWYQGEFFDPAERFDVEVMKSLRELMNTQEALYGITDSMGDTMEHIRMLNIAVADGVVYYYLYYDEAGFVGLAYDSTRATLTDKGDYALPLTKTSDTAEGQYEWFITYHMEE